MVLSAPSEAQHPIPLLALDPKYEYNGQSPAKLNPAKPSTPSFLQESHYVVAVCHMKPYPLGSFRGSYHYIKEDDDEETLDSSYCDPIGGL